MKKWVHFAGEGFHRHHRGEFLGLPWKSKIPDVRKGRFRKSVFSEQIRTKTRICFPYAQCNSAFLLESHFIQLCYIVVVLHPPITYMSTLGLRVAGPSRSHLEGELGMYGEDGKDFWRTVAGKGERLRLRLEESTREQMPTISYLWPELSKCTHIPSADQGILGNTSHKKECLSSGMAQISSPPQFRQVRLLFSEVKNIVLRI